MKDERERRNIRLNGGRRGRRKEEAMKEAVFWALLTNRGERKEDGEGSRITCRAHEGLGQGEGTWHVLGLAVDFGLVEKTTTRREET